MCRFVSLLVVASLQGCFWVSGGDQDERTADLDRDGIPNVDDCTPTVPGDANGTVFFADADGDTFGDASETTTACTVPEGYVEEDGDCDDDNAAVNPDAKDTCNGLDDDCDDKVDESPSTEWFLDGDGDGYGGGDPFFSCSSPGLGYTTAGEDCDDADAKTYPDAPVICEGEDHDCDGLLDNADADVDGFPGCQECDDTAKDVFPGANETCDGRDEDCDGAVDEDSTDATAWYADADGDTFGDAASVVESCATALPNHAKSSDDCDDGDDAVHPGAVEICDGIDQDCDKSEATATDAETFYVDADNDGYGDGDGDPPAMKGCTEPDGYSRLAGDCDDADAKYNPSAKEDNCGDLSDYNCDGSVGQVDGDADGFYACEECDDTNKFVNPGASEVCNLVDDDCDGAADESDAIGSTPWYADADTDGYGSPSASVISCTRPAGYVADATDCDDATKAIHPGAAEVCSTPGDDDCDGTINESDAFDAKAWYADADADTFGNPTLKQTACLAPGGYVASDKDCDDTRASVNPGAVEVCDTSNLDEDCDGAADDLDPGGASGTTKWFADADGDKYGNKLSSKSTCDVPGTYVGNDQDCNDGDAKYNPGAVEVCTDTLDYNCDGAIGAKDADGDSHIACEECNDNDKSVYPGAPEVAGDKIDQDCDGVDSCYKDGDLDGYGIGALIDSKDLTCAAGLAGAGGDCDDVDPADHPNALEIVGNDDDEDCDGVEVCYVDNDDDGFGVSTTTKSTTTTCGTKLAKVPGDCDDVDKGDYPGSTEIVANNDDENCDTREVCYVDLDGDKFGSKSTLQSTDADCLDLGEAVNDTDCDDADKGDFPGAVEVPVNNDDENCDTKELCYVDADGDKFGSGATTASSPLDCSAPGVASRAGDCNDSNALMNPQGKEGIGDGIDQNCDGGDVCFIDQDADKLRHHTLTINSTDLDCLDIYEAGKSVTVDCNDYVANGDADSDGIKDCVDSNCPRWVDDSAASTVLACGDATRMCRTITKAFTDHGSCTTVFVLPGIYTENVDYNGVDYLLASTEGAGSTIIDGANKGSVVVFENGETVAATLQGFLLRNGNGNSPKVTSSLFFDYSFYRFGGGIYVDNASPTIVANVIRNNDLTASNGPSFNSPAAGGGIFMNASNAIVAFNVITLNEAVTGGGGIASIGSYAWVTGNQINDNTTGDGAGDGVFLAGDLSTIVGNAIYRNDQINVAVVGSVGALVNNLIIDASNTNLAVNGDDFTAFVNNTIVGATNGVGFSADSDSGGLPNSTFVNNQVTDAESCGVVGDYGSVTFLTNNAYTATGTAVCGVPVTGGNISLPVTYDPDWRLYAGSGGIGTGTNQYVELGPYFGLPGYADDFDGEDVRSHTGPWNMGAQHDINLALPPTGN